jgi:hypothetical protein
MALPKECLPKIVGLLAESDRLIELCRRELTPERNLDLAVSMAQTHLKEAAILVGYADQISRQTVPTNHDESASPATCER